MVEKRVVLVNVVAVLLMLVFPAFATVEEGRILVSLSWDFPEESPCMGGEALVREVESMLGREVFVSQGSADVMVRIRVFTTDPGWAAEVKMLRADGSLAGVRHLGNPMDDCVELSHSLPVVIGLMVDVPRTEVLLPEALRPDPVPPPKPIESISPAPKSPWLGRVGAGPSGGLGLVPSYGWGAHVRVGVQSPSFWGIELQGRGLHGSVEKFGGIARFQSFDGALLGCARMEFLAGIGICGGLRAGQIRATPSGFDVELPQTRLTASALVSVHGAVPLSERWALQLGGESGIGLLRDEFEFQDVQGGRHRFHRPSFVQGSVDLSIVHTLAL